VHGLPRRVNLVDRNMHVEVVGVVVDSTYPLMGTISQTGADAPFDCGKDFGWRVLPGREGKE
jgi:hypothetical protein